MSKPKVLNFQWALDGKMATGGKPSYSYQLEWLKEQGFKAILSLEEIPDTIVEGIKQAGINHLLLEADSEEGTFDAQLIPSNDWQLFCEFVGTCLEQHQLLFIHCSAGISRSVQMVRRYLTEHPTE